MAGEGQTLAMAWTLTQAKEIPKDGFMGVSGTKSESRNHQVIALNSISFFRL
jgi:hypothetical protein